MSSTISSEGGAEHAHSKASQANSTCPYLEVNYGLANDVNQLKRKKNFIEI